jgi:formate/nitrite transporter FocA (FNT family)
MSKRTSPRKAIAAGVLICMGCIVHLQLQAVSRILAALFFSAGLWFVIQTKAELFTGRVASPDYSISQKLLMLIYNLIGAFLCGFTASLVFPDLTPILPVFVPSTVLPIIWKSVMCGVCMYLATMPSQQRLPNVVYGVTLFILSGYAHSIALAGYVAIARFPFPTLLVIPIAAVGNAMGSYLMKFLISERSGH